MRTSLISRTWRRRYARSEGAGPWFEPNAGLATVRGLIQYFEKSPSSESEGPLAILRSLETELAYAKDRESRFHLNFAE